MGVKGAPHYQRKAIPSHIHPSSDHIPAASALALNRGICSISIPNEVVFVARPFISCA